MGKFLNIKLEIKNAKNKICTIICWLQTQKMSLVSIKGKLSRAEMKNIMAGSGLEPCSMTFRDSACTWHTENGVCSTDTFISVGYHVVTDHFCKTVSFPHPVALTSNGGVSKCGARQIM
jgi:hypothetical protein